MTAVIVASHAASAAEPRPDAQLPQPVTRAKQTDSATLEHGNKVLALAKLRQQTMPTLENERTLAQVYASAGVLDAAFDHFTAALLLDPHDVPSLDGLARIWRDWGYLQNALPRAYQAVYWSPGSAAAHNTLGTVLLRLGEMEGAQQRFATARALEPDAAYPLNNLCFLALRRGRPADAAPLCREAAALNGSAPEVRNNLALALATSGDLDGAFAAFATGSSPAVAAYNQGIVLLSARLVGRAREAFARARIADPAFVPALTRLKQLAALEGH
ncbi:MAG: tetratricopeptide repeat protein [Vicinamibacterales bacterium]